MSERDSNDFYLDIFGQQPGIKIYTQISSCFAVSDASLHSEIVTTLTAGLEKLTAGFPWTAGQVVTENEGRSETTTDTFKIVPWERIPRLVVKDLRQDPSIPDFDTLSRHDFPFSMLDEKIIAARKTLPDDIEISQPFPVFLVQANFITGGLILTFIGEHNVMDMTGQAHIIHLLSKSCHNQQLTDEELCIGNASRRHIVPVLDASYKVGSELKHSIMHPTSEPSNLADVTGSSSSPPPQSSNRPVKCCWAYFCFSSASLVALKSLAIATVTSPPGYISTDDALSAFIWQSVLRIRLPRLSRTTESTFARAVDARRYIGLSQSYPGLAQNMTYNTNTIKELIEKPLGVVASDLRLNVDPKTSDLGFRTRALATFLTRVSDKSIVSFTATINPSVDIMLSSWAKEKLYHLDFNLGLGKPVSVRRPQFEPVESLMYLMPRRPDGEIAVGICLREEDMQRLRCDGDFTKYARYIG